MDTQVYMKKVPIFFYYMSVETERSSTPYDATNTANVLCAVFRATPHISKEKTTALSLDKEKCGLVVFYWQGKLN